MRRRIRWGRRVLILLLILLTGGFFFLRGKLWPVVQNLAQTKVRNITSDLINRRWEYTI